MSQSLVQFLSGLVGKTGMSQKVADCAISSTTLTSVYGNGGAAAYIDFGSDLFMCGAYKIRFKSVGGFTTAGAQLNLVVATNSTFTTHRQIVATIMPVSAAATVTVPEYMSFVGWFDADPTAFRYARWENAGVVIGSTAVTFDWEVLALP